jgi:uracil-DNA glycosylase
MPQRRRKSRKSSAEVTKNSNALDLAKAKVREAFSHKPGWEHDIRHLSIVDRVTSIGAVATIGTAANEKARPGTDGGQDCFESQPLSSRKSRATPRAASAAPLYLRATQVVMGEGPAPADIMMVGEQPGDQEDRAGRPFVGPAGRVLDEALAEIGLDRAKVYVTNAVKHFKFEQSGRRRLHKHPNRYEVERCRWWLDLELKLVAPKLVVALGATAARELLGRPVTLAKERDRLLRLADGRAATAAIHPSAVLRMRDAGARREAFAAFVADLRRAKRAAESASEAG